MFKIIFLITTFIVTIYADNKNLNLTKHEMMWIEKHPIINVGGELDWAPFDFVDENDNYNGLAKDYLDEIAKIAGFKVKYHTGKNWTDLLASLKSGELDILPALYKNRQREEYIEFTTPYLTLPEYIFTKNQNLELNSFEKLNGHTIVQVKGYTIIPWIKEHYPNINIIEKDSILECLLSIKSGESVAFIGDNPSTTYNIKKNFITGIHLNNIVESRKPIKLYMGIKKEYKTLATIINKVIKSQGTDVFSHISTKWMKVTENNNLILTEIEKKWMEENPISRIAVMEYWPHDYNGDSLHTEILKLINYYSGLHLVPIKFKGWKEGYKKAKDGIDIDGIMGLSWSKERESSFKYSPAYNFSPAYLVTRKSNSTIKSIKDLKNKTVILQENEITNNLLKEKVPLSKIITYDSLDLMYKNFAEDTNVSAMFSYFLKEKLIEKYDLKIVEELYDRYGEVAIGTHQSQEILSSIINKTFKIIPKNELSFLRDKDWGNTKNKEKISREELEYIEKNNTFKVCINPNWEPIEFINNDKVKGISIDLLNIIKENLKINFEYVKTSSWSESQKFLKEKRCDILPSASKTIKRSEYANFTNPYVTYDLIMVTRSNGPLINSLESIKTQTMSRKKGSGLISKLESQYPDLNIVKTSSYLESLNKVIDGDVYFTISTLPVFSYFKSKYELQELQIAGYTDLKYDLSMAVRNDNEILLSILNKSLKKISKSTLDIVHEKWATPNVVKSTDWDLLIKLFFIIFLIIILILMYNRKLKSMVDDKTKDINEQKEELVSLMKSLDKNVIYSKCDTKGILTHVSDAFCRISGYSKIELIGKPYSIVRHHDTPDSLYKTIWENVKKEIVFQFEIKNMNKDGDFYWIKTHVEPEYDVNNSLVGYNSLVTNITDKKAIEELSKNLENLVEERTYELEIAKIEVEEIHKHTKDSIQYASLIQHSLIPSDEILNEHFEDYFTIWDPKDIVGGDIYLFEELRSKDECLLMIIDCTGHGVPGAFVTMLVKAIERQIVATIKHNVNQEVNTGRLLQIFNKHMKKILGQESKDSISNAGFDGGILYYNKKDKIIKYSGAEIPLFYIDKDNELKTIRGNRHSIGYKKSNPDFEFKEHTIELERGMQFYLTTDGYLDQNGGAKGFPFGKKRFFSLINENSKKSFPEQKKAFLDELNLYQADEDRSDDVTFVAFKV